MIVCPKCNKQLEEGTKFCDGCGSPIQEAATVFCPNCGNPTSSEFEYCQRCGFSIATKPTPAKTKPTFPTKLLKFAAIGVVAVIAVIFLASLLFGGKGENYTLYIKDDEIFYRNVSKKEAVQATDELFDGLEMTNYDIMSSSYKFANMCRLSEDGKILFHPDKLEEDEGFTLYYSYVNKLDKEATKIDSEVDYYFVNEKATLVTYLKDNGSDGGVLNQFVVKSGDKNKIASDVVDFYATEDGKNVVFLNNDGDLYIKSGSGDKEKIDSDVEEIERFTGDAVYYMKEDTLNKCVYGKDKEKIASDVSNVIAIYESGEIYYIESETETVSAMDMVDDDVEDDDEDYEYIREYLEDMEYEKTTSTLYYYDGKEAVSVTDTYSSYSDYALETPVIICSTAPGMVKLSDMEDAWDFYDLLYEADSEKCVVVGSEMVPFDYDDARYFRISDDGKTVYFLSDVDDEKGEGDLCRFTVSSKGKLGDVETCDSDVSSERIYFASNDKFVYFKDYDSEDYKGELFINGKSVSSDVYLYSTRYNEDTDKMYFFTDWNSEKARGTLNVYNGKKAEKMADDVHSFMFSANNEVLYIADYSTKNYKGDLYLYKKNNPKKLDTDVVAVLPIY